MSDRRQLAIPGTACPLVHNHSRAFADAVERALERVRHPESDNTRRAYGNAWRAWVQHCNAEHVPALPIEPTHLIAYLERLSKTHAPNTVRLHLSALSSIDQAARVTPADPKPTTLRETVIVRRWLKSWSRDNPRAPKRQAPAIERTEIERILIAAQERRDHASRHAHAARYARDRCVILFGLTGAFRADELAALDFADVSRNSRGLQVMLRKSKTDQHGEGKLKGLMPQGQILRCPIDAWHQWSTLRGNWHGPAFVPIARSGEIGRERLNVEAVYRLVETRAKAAGLSITSHSMRATFATLARARNKPIEQIMKQAGWTSTRTAIGYFRGVDLFEDNPSAGLLDD